MGGYKSVVFQKIRGQKSKGGTARLTDRPTNRLTNTVTYRVALPATKNYSLAWKLIIQEHFPSPECVK